jgi:large-conductance mechanosensitive channel
MKKKNINFIKWLFEKRDVDGLIIAFLLSAAVNSFIADFTVAIVDPVINGLLPTTNQETKQVLNINDYIIIDFKLQYIISGLVRLLITFFLALLIVKYIFQLFSLD